MKIKLFTIPNILTLSNLLCGSLAVIAIISRSDYKAAFMLIILAALFDFFDGFAARLLKQCSPMGGELDSLADMVSFGLAPALVMMSLIRDGGWCCELPLLAKYGVFIPLIIVAFSALRLAKFNIDEEQSCVFIGLPTPACALMCISLGLMHLDGVVLGGELVALISVVLALLLISPIKMFALKFKGFGWCGNELRYGFIAVSVVLLCLLKFNALPLIVAIYIALSTLIHLLCKKKA
ncbi:MAG: CDP-diacylglycerol--serine O-phosphatidyltransferase [Rikenellaceae bacterium]